MDELNARHVVMETPVPEYDRKQMHYASSNLARSRTVQGLAMRSAPPEKRV